MKLLPVLLLGAVLALSGCAPSADDQGGEAAGHWQGAIALPDAELAIRVDLEHASGGWSGTMDIPAQGLRGFKLGRVRVRGDAVSFTMPGIPRPPPPKNAQQ